MSFEFNYINVKLNIPHTALRLKLQRSNNINYQDLLFKSMMKIVDYRVLLFYF